MAIRSLVHHWSCHIVHHGYNDGRSVLHESLHCFSLSDDILYVSFVSHRISQDFLIWYG